MQVIQTLGSATLVATGFGGNTLIGGAFDKRLSSIPKPALIQGNQDMDRVNALGHISAATHLALDAMAI